MTAQISEQSGLAKRYATALFSLAAEKKEFDGVAVNLAALEAMIEESADFQRFLASPLLRREDQGKAILALAKQAGFSALVSQFLGLLAQNRRLFALPGIIKTFQTMLAKERGEESATVLVARPLSASQEQALAEAIRRMAGGKVSVAIKIDPSLLGGLIVQIGSRMIDNSLKTKLQKMRLLMKGVA